MPTYEYRCKTCGQELEVVQSFTDDALTTCEACGGELRKVFGNVGIAFKGSGFYKNDSRGKAASSSGGADKADAKGGSSDKSGDAGTKTDTSPSPSTNGTPASTTPSPAKADKAPSSTT